VPEFAPKRVSNPADGSALYENKKLLKPTLMKMDDKKALD
jgi:hypothetical protein